MAANMKTEEQDNLISIQKQYLQMVPIKFFDWKNIAQNLDSSVQKAILQKTYMNNQFVKYTPSIKYKRAFLKQLMRISEEGNYELADELYECYTQVISKVDDDQSPCYKTYILPSGTGIIIEESQNIISQGTTGLSTWKAALYMLEWVLENSKVFENRNVVELGCGLGLLGLSICVSCSPQHYVFTDCHETVLMKLNKNFYINGYQMNADSNCHCGEEESKCPCVSRSKTLFGSYWSIELDKEEHFGEELQISDRMEQGTLCNTCQEGNKYNIGLMSMRLHPPSAKAVDSNCIGKVEVKESSNHHRKERRDRDKADVASMMLNWEDVSLDDLEGLSCGVIVATDVIYDVELIKFFVPVVFKLLSCHGDGVHKPVAFVASTVRSPETFEYFLQELAAYHIKWTVLDRPSTKLFFYDDNSDIRLMKIEI